MTSAQHDAWEQILSVARNAGLADGAELAARYLNDGGFTHIVRRIEPGWVPAPALDTPIAAAAPIEAEPHTADAPQGGAPASGDDHQ